MSDEKEQPKFESGPTYIDRFLKPNQKGPVPQDRSPEGLKAVREARERRRAASKKALYDFGRRQ